MWLAEKPGFEERGKSVRLGGKGSGFFSGCIAMVVTCLGGTAIAVAQNGPTSSIKSQVGAGRQAYARQCAVCHGPTLDGTSFAPATRGSMFQKRWGGRTLDELYKFVSTTMPPTGAGQLDEATYTALVALIAQENGAELGKLVLDRAAFTAMRLPGGAIGNEGLAVPGIGAISQRMPMPPWPAPPDRFAKYAPVTQAMLSAPAAENWLSWRRSHAGTGFSPLKQINVDNVRNLRVAWSQPLPAGPTMTEPLVRDGVLYAYGFGDEVFAFDAADGSLLWRYRHPLGKDVPLTSKKTMALLGDKLFVPTSDVRMVALDARTGRVVWDSKVMEGDYLITGGPLAVDGVVMQGLTAGGQGRGKGLIVGLDAETGRRLWTFNPIPAPGEPGGESWNGIPDKERTGVSVWTSGTYDEITGLAYWGTGQTYNTGPLIKRRPGMSNDALFTNTTLALEPKTGRLAWYFQHMKNDQYDLDWAFERTLGTLKLDGVARRVVITGGKAGLFDVLDAKTGQYLKTADMGLQNFVRAIDPRTGDKKVDPSLLPGGGKTVFVCPHAGGGRNWLPSSFVEAAHTLYTIGRAVCMDLVPDEHGFMTSNVRLEFAPRPKSDGRYGVLQAIDMQTGKIRWDVRQRAPYVMGVLTTAGGLTFTGSIDRQFIAYDQATGRELWRQGVSDVPNAAPISYSVDGKQYVAMVVGHGNPMSGGLFGMTPEIVVPTINSAAIYVFALPDP